MKRASGEAKENVRTDKSSIVALCSIHLRLHSRLDDLEVTMCQHHSPLIAGVYIVCQVEEDNTHPDGIGADGSETASSEARQQVLHRAKLLLPMSAPHRLLEPLIADR